MDEERKLAYIVRIDEVKEIPGYDRVEYARNRGWWCIVRKDQFKIGDLAIYFEIDSLVPATKPFEFLESKKFKIKTQKMCGVYSQGLLMSPIDFGWGSSNEYVTTTDGKQLKVGDDCTKILGVKYYIPEDNIRKSSKIDPNAKFKSMAQRHAKLFKTPVFKWLMRRKWGKKLLFVFFGKKKDKPLHFPTKFQFIHKTDEDRCLDGRTKIVTNKGKIAITDIVNKHMDVLVKTYNLNTNQFEFKPIINYQKFNPEDTIRIRYKKGIFKHPTLHSSGSANSIVCSKDHRLLTTDGYKRAEDIKLSDKVMMPFITYDSDAIAILYGMLLGDSYLSMDKRRGDTDTCRVYFTQGEKQIDYLKEKRRLFGITSDIRKGKSGYCDNNTYTTNITVDEYLTQLLVSDNAIQDGKLNITDAYCKRLNEASLAFWYLDDGCLRHNNDDMFSPSIEFSTHAYNLKEVKAMCNRLSDFNVESYIYEAKKYGKFIGYTIKLNVENTKKFLALVSPYIPYCMRYKTTDNYKNVKYLLEDKVYNKNEKLLPVEIIDIKNTLIKHTLYDIEVEDNHNFIANDIISHNCENVWLSLEGNKDKWIQTTKIDGSSATYIMERKPFGRMEYYVCSRNVRLLKPDQDCFHDKNYYWEASDKYCVKDFLSECLKNNPQWDYVCLQGEIAGPNIQGNPHKFKELRLFGFNFIDSENGRWNSIEAAKFCREHSPIEWVPVIRDDYVIPDTLEELKLQADGECEAPGASGLREGFVYRSQDGQRSFKNVSRKYLMKHE